MRFRSVSSKYKRAAFGAAPNGIIATAGDTTLQVTALRDDVLRVREWKGNAAPEDASWAVLPSARTSRVEVVAEPRRFATKQLRVKLDDELRLTVMDVAGNVLQEDATPVRWDGTGFTISKRRTSKDHFFGLGDKPGPLDRAGEVFTLWNTDSFGWQESTDPIYKSIPCFLEITQGRALGLSWTTLGVPILILVEPTRRNTHLAH